MGSTVQPFLRRRNCSEQTSEWKFTSFFFLNVLQAVESAKKKKKKKQKDVEAPE